MFDWVITLVNSILQFFYEMYLTVVQVVENWVYFLLGELLSIVVWVFNGISHLFKPIDVSKYFDMLPPDAVDVMSMLGLPQMMAMIIAAIMVRLVLQLIPFTRLGS